MRTLVRNCVYLGKDMYREKSFTLWVILFPLIMAVFFYTAFSGILNPTIADINVGLEKSNPLRIVFENIEIVQVKLVEKDDLTASFAQQEIDGFVDKNLNLTITESGISQSVLKEILDQIKQTSKLNLPLENFDFEMNYIVQKNQKADAILIIFYSLIAMVSVYSVFAALEIASLMQANLSEKGKRINATPISKGTFIITSIINSMVSNLLSNALLVLFLKYVLKLNLFNEWGHTILLIVAGNLFGITLGTFIGVSSTLNTEIKTMIGIGTTLFFSFLAGMMSPEVKVFLDKKAPFVGKLNPISIITNNLYRVNLLGIKDNVMTAILTLLFMSLVFTLASYLFLRRKRYDSL